LVLSYHTYFFKGFLRYTHNSLALLFIIYTTIYFLLVEHLTNKKPTLKGCFKHKKVVVNNSNDGKIRLLLWVEILSLRIIFEK